MQGHPIGWCDESDPHGQGYMLMTDDGLKQYDISDKKEYDSEKQSIKEQYN